jgi:hypothetical protein
MHIKLFTWGKSKQAPLLVSGKTHYLEEPKLMTLLQNGKTATFEYSTIVRKREKHSCCSDFSEHFLHRHSIVIK